MEVFTTKDAAARAGVTVRRWHYLVGKHRLTPVVQADGLRGAMVWGPDAIEAVRQLSNEAAA